MNEILYYTFLSISFLLSAWLVLRNGKRSKAKEYKTFYKSAYEKSRNDFLNRRNK